MWRNVLDFWFSERVRPNWFARSDALDREITERFGSLVDESIAGAHGDWVETAQGALALVVELDQLARNIYRGTPRAFAGDPRAIEIARMAVDRGDSAALTLDQRMFLYMPFQHSEVLADQERSLALFTQWTAEHDAASRASAEEDLVYARRHHEIIARFGRFPHRNAILGRPSSAEEIAFLAQPGSGF